ncbi:hypothetical protein D3C75_365240 [compost metagenome]
MSADIYHIPGIQRIGQQSEIGNGGHNNNSVCRRVAAGIEMGQGVADIDVLRKREAQEHRQEPAVPALHIAEQAENKGRINITLMHFGA